MTDPHILVPEITLLSPLPKHLQTRFEKALGLMHKQLDQELSWEQIAIESAISPYHFHRQFKDLFKETPGQYHSRLRLKQAVSLLLLSEPQPITSIAHQCGFSSSQALAKALKRQLGVTAKAIQKLAKKGTPLQTIELLEQVAHPSASDTLEQELAQKMPTEIVWYAQRGYRQLKVKDYDWDYLLERFDEKVVNLMTITPIAQLDQPWESINVLVGDWRCDSKSKDMAVPEGHYLCAEVLIASPTAYLSALESLFDLAEKQGMKVNYQGQLLEFVLDANDDYGVIFSFQLPLLD